MDLLLRLVTPRKFILLMLLILAGHLWLRYGHLAREAAVQWLYPPQPPTFAGMDITEKMEKSQARRLESRYRRILAKLSEARAAGFEVSALEAKAKAALLLNRPETRRDALQTLSDIEMAIPHPRVQYIPMYSNEEEEKVSEDVQPPPSAKGKKKRKR